jgi:transcriptional regulator with XRE-family HTH domain
MHSDQRDLAGADLARWIRTRRMEEMLTQEQLAELAGVSVRTVRNLEAGHHTTPRLQTRRLVIAALRRTDAVDAGSLRPAQLPADALSFVGRAVELGRLDNLHRDRDTSPHHAPMLVVLTGRSGAGKTALAVHWAHRVRRGFGDGQIFLNLRGHTAGREPMPPLAGLTLALRSLGLAEQDVPADLDAAASLYRTLFAERRILVVLDDAHDVHQVRSLLPGGPGNAVVLTSRHRLTDLVIREGAARLEIGGLDEADACTLLAAIVGHERARAEPAAIVEIARECAHLPLILRLAANELGTRPRQRAGEFAAALRRRGFRQVVDEVAHVADLQTVLETI